MSFQPASVAILWHMHQPYYRDPVSGRSVLPWVRLHAVKDYHAMAILLERFPGVHCTVNWVPSLVKQLLEYTEQGLSDDFLDLSRRPPGDLSSPERMTILRNFFMTNWNLVIRRSQRYAELLEKRGFTPQDRDLERIASVFSSQDYLDLQVWFNLAWFHPLHVETDPNLAALLEKGRNFSEADKSYVLDRQGVLMAEVIPAWRRLAASGQVELSTSPYYHPILPLLVNMESTWEAMPGADLPAPRLVRPGDAALQLERAVAFHTEVFGVPPAGLWPSEGSVSEEMLPLVMANGFRWMATDEEILYRSLATTVDGRSPDDPHRCGLLYQPYLLRRKAGELSLLFRDHVLSDAIGFTYSSWDPRTAALDLIRRLETSARAGRATDRPPLISLILDGENPWEYFPEQGGPFLRELYGMLQDNQELRPRTVSESLAAVAPRVGFDRLAAGSWINSNFQIWIGHQEDRRAWELLAHARLVLDELAERVGPEHPSYLRALEEILIAEGSDWCWWYGEENSSGNDDAFDELYRQHLQNVYTIAGREVPDELKVSVFSAQRAALPDIRIYSFINPVIDGRVSSYFEWLAAGKFPVDRQGATMHRAERYITAIFFGFNAGKLFLRLDPDAKAVANDRGRFTFSIHFMRPRKQRVTIRPLDAPAVDLTLVSATGVQGEPPIECAAAMKDILELALPFDLLGAGVGERIDFFVTISWDGHEVGHWPTHGYLSVTVPDADFEEKLWSL